MVSELFSPLQVGVGSIQYPVNGPSYQIAQPTGGNINLQPEKAVTTTFGAVLTPQFVPGLTVSLDWYISTSTEASTRRVRRRKSIAACRVKPSIANSSCSAPANSAELHPTRLRGFLPTQPSIQTSGLDLSANYVMAVA